MDLLRATADDPTSIEADHWSPTPSPRPSSEMKVTAKLRRVDDLMMVGAHSRGIRCRLLLSAKLVNLAALLTVPMAHNDTSERRQGRRG